MKYFWLTVLFIFYNGAKAQKFEISDLQKFADAFEIPLSKTDGLNDSIIKIKVFDWSKNFLLGHEPKCITYQSIPKTLDSSKINNFLDVYNRTKEINLKLLDPENEFYSNSFHYPFCEKELAEFRNFFRWIQNFDLERLIWVNIPSNELYYFEKQVLVLKMNVIVGTYKNQTPVFTSQVESFTLFPYWYPTTNIIFDEIIPKTIADVSFLTRNNYEVLNKKGVAIDPSSLSWSTFTRNNFSYRIRQKTGCGNSLGLIKFNLKNPFSIYMHDTQHTKTSLSLFNKPRRFYSHGCVRLQKPKELALALNPSKPIDDEFMKDCPADKKPMTVSLKKPVPVFFMYFTDFINEKGELITKPDYYKLLH